MEALLVLEDGATFKGNGFGANGETYGEVVFNTSITGYQEILTDPSYNGQIVIMTYPEIGNYGINPEDTESKKPFVRGLVVKEYWPNPSNWRSHESLCSYLSRHGVVGIDGIDTRELTRRIRTRGAQRGVISTVDLDPESLSEKVHLSPSILGIDLATEVSCTEPYRWHGGSDWKPIYDQKQEHEKQFKVVAYDFGIKHNILRRLVDIGCEVWVIPARTAPQEVLSMNPNGIVLSNGPGDPVGVSYAVESVRTLIGKKPIFGICLGHQVIGLALGGKTYKLKFGHRGANHKIAVSVHAAIANVRRSACTRVPSRRRDRAVQAERTAPSLVDRAPVPRLRGLRGDPLHRLQPLSAAALPLRVFLDPPHRRMLPGGRSSAVDDSQLARLPGLPEEHQGRRGHGEAPPRRPPRRMSCAARSCRSGTPDGTRTVPRAPVESARPSRRRG